MRVLLALLATAVALSARPVEFEFVPPASQIDPNPFSREIWASVVTPSGRTVTLPAYYDEAGAYVVRARPDEVGVYRFGDVSETTRGVRTLGLVVSLASPPQVEVTARERLPAVGIDPARPGRFIRSDGRTYVPVGTNLAWCPDGVPDVLGYYRGAFEAFSKANLNWMRVWMVHWDGMNLDWLPRGAGMSPKPGTVSPEVAARWDRLVEMADESGVYLQLVLQHHGQYTTVSNPNWAENPWNAANPGGFLKAPEDFFTNPNAKIATLLKYRYIVARWGWSPAVLSWELFNEVHWTNAMRSGRVAEVAAWHGLMADYIRSVDAYGHLVTTSTEDLESPIFAKMDYLQPHLYAVGMIGAARTFAPGGTGPKPVFYGEEGGEKAGLNDAVMRAGLDLVPPVWASIMGAGTMPAQPWDGWKLLQSGRLGEVGAVHRFLARSGALNHPDLRPFSARVTCPTRVPLDITAGEYWQRRAPVDLDYPLDGTEPLGAADIAATLVGHADSVSQGFPDRATYRLDMPRASTMRLCVSSVSERGGGLRVRVDGATAAEHTWPPSKGVDPGELVFQVGAGRHVVEVDNPEQGWIGFGKLVTGLEAPVLAAIGRRDPSFIEAWVWHRSNLYSLDASKPESGVIHLDDVPAGSWKVVWWDAVAGSASGSFVVEHKGGQLDIPTPPVTRYAALSLSRSP